MKHRKLDAKRASTAVVLHCASGTRHVPAVHTLQNHHVVPKSWGTDGHLVAICGTHHDAAHALLNLYIHAGGRPPLKQLERFDEFTRGLAEYAWKRRPSDKPPYTTASGKQEQ